jgi:hypothetical protein
MDFGNAEDPMVKLGRVADPVTLARTDAWSELDPASLTSHAVCVGMTGSGKTGLCIGLLEALAAHGVPILAIDPKGDLSNLALVFEDLSPVRFARWVTSGDPAAVAAMWAQGLAREGMGPEAMAAWRDRVDVQILTPGSEAGIPVDVLSALSDAPPHLRGDDEGLREYVTGCVGALLGLIGREGDPIKDPAAILIAMVLRDAFEAGRSMPLDRLISAVVDPPFSQVGSFAVDAFLPRARRLELARSLNAVMASPAFAGWRRGVALDVGAWLTPDPSGKTPVRVVYLAHLDDRQRMFFVTLLLHAVVAWTRRLPGTQDLRALVYFDEVMGYLPPHPRNPPSKAPVLTLMKQARAVGVGVMLVTQNPVDIDYKAMSNAGTWLVGRLLTRQDRQRVLDGLSTAGVDTSQLDDLITRLPSRTFLVRGSGPPRAVCSRHTFSYLRGPLTRAEVAALGQTWTAAPSTLSAELRSAPPLPEGLPARWLLREGLSALGLQAGEPVQWRPAIYARFQVQFDEPGYLADEVVHRLLWPADPEGEPKPVALADPWLGRVPVEGGTYAPAPAWLADAKDVAELRSSWVTVVRMSARHEGPDGVLSAEREDVVVAGLVLVWVPVGG